MRIDDVNRSPQSQATDRAQQTGSKDKNQLSANLLEDQAELSSLAQANFAQPPDAVDQKRLDALKLAVESGQYRVPASELAGSIINSHIKA